MKKIKINTFLLSNILIIVVYCICGCGGSSRDDFPTVQPERELTPSVSIPSKTTGHGEQKFARKVPSLQTILHEELIHEALTVPLIAYYNIHGRFPTDIGELLRSGLMMIWPAEFTTHEPYKVVDELSPANADYGEIAYVRESDDRAYFKLVVPDYSSTGRGDQIVKLPSEEMWEQILHDQDNYPPERKTNWHLEDAFVSELFTMYQRLSQWVELDYKKRGANALTVEDILSGYFFWIEENFIPDCVSTSPDIPGYFEMGWAKLHGKRVTFYRATTRVWDESSNDRNVITVCYSRYMDAFQINTLEDLPPTIAIDCSNWYELTDKVYIYSTERALNRTLDMPSSVVISIADILEN